MDSFHRQESEGLDRAAQLLVTFASVGRTEEPAANASHVPPPTKQTDGQESAEVRNATDPDGHGLTLQQPVISGSDPPSPSFYVQIVPEGET